MTITCKKCGYTRRPEDAAPDYECPQCGVVYAKYDAWLKKHPEAIPSRYVSAAVFAQVTGRPLALVLEEVRNGNLPGTRRDGEALVDLARQPAVVAELFPKPETRAAPKTPTTATRPLPQSKGAPSATAPTRGRQASAAVTPERDAAALAAIRSRAQAEREARERPEPPEAPEPMEPPKPAEMPPPAPADPTPPKLTTPCRICRQEVAISARFCPHCGQKHPGVPGAGLGSATWALATVVITVVAVMTMFAGALDETGKRDSGHHIFRTPSLGDINRQVALNAEREYEVARQQAEARYWRPSDHMQVCVQAGFVAAAYLQAQDASGYRKWKDAEDHDCWLAGVRR